MKALKNMIDMVEYMEKDLMAIRNLSASIKAGNSVSISSLCYRITPNAPQSKMIEKAVDSMQKDMENTYNRYMQKIAEIEDILTKGEQKWTQETDNSLSQN